MTVEILRIYEGCVTTKFTLMLQNGLRLRVAPNFAKPDRRNVIRIIECLSDVFTSLRGREMARTVFQKFIVEVH